MAKRSVRYKGKNYESKRICGKYFALIERLSGPRERYKSFDPVAGPGGELCMIQVLPRTEHVIKQLRWLKGVRNINVPTILYFETQGKNVLVVLSWFHGLDLKRYLSDVSKKRASVPTPTEGFRLFRGLAHGVSNLNKKKGIVHGDIKPANLILTKEPTGLCLIDFGSSWHLEVGYSAESIEGTTPQYGAPEFQVPNFELGMPGFHSDQFSTSVVLFELLTLKVPYESLGGAAGASAASRKAFASKLGSCYEMSIYPDDLPMTLWRSIDKMLRRSLQFDPSKRFQTPSKWLNAVDSIYDGIKRQGRLGLLERTTLDLLDVPSRFAERIRRFLYSPKR